MEQINGEERLTLTCPLYNSENAQTWWERRGRAFEFSTMDWEDFEEEAGVFAFVKEAPKNEGRTAWDVLYIGEAEDFSKELPNHPKWAEAQTLGATHVVLRPIYEENFRTVGMWQWMSRYLPPMNAPYDGAPSFLRCSRVGRA